MVDSSESRLPSVISIKDLKPGAKNIHLVVIVLDIGKKVALIISNKVSNVPIGFCLLMMLQNPSKIL